MFNLDKTSGSDGQGHRMRFSVRLNGQLYPYRSAVSRYVLEGSFLCNLLALQSRHDRQFSDFVFGNLTTSIDDSNWDLTLSAICSKMRWSRPVHGHGASCDGKRSEDETINLNSVI